MILRERDLRPPRSLRNRGPAALRRLRGYAALRGQAKSQRRWPFELEIVHQPDVVAQLTTLFDGKCAYCETPVSAPLVEWHRPPEEAMDLDGAIARDHYWWLVYDWENLYPSCPDCQSHRGRRFPVLRRRADPEARGAELDDEGALLLDPSRDDPERYLRYQPDGTVVGTDRRSHITVDLLRLNRADLVAARGDAAAEVATAVEAWTSSRGRTGKWALGDLVANRQPYAGIRRWTARRMLIEQGGYDDYFASLGLAAAEPVSLVRRTVAGGIQVREPLITPDTADPLWNVRLEHVEIRNFKSIQRITLDFREPLPDREPWLLLLGENGVGKSSILRAIALALVDEDERHRRAPDVSGVLRRGTRSGAVRLAFSDGREIGLGYRAGSPRFDVAGEAPPLVVLGYGPTRLPPPPNLTPPPPQRIDVDNLFDPRAPLSDAEHWLVDVASVSTRRFDIHATDLKALLPMAAGDRLFRRSGRLYATTGGVTVPLPELSDGYRSVIALATDLMLHLSAYWESMRAAEGLLLLDELEVHLHPQWRMSVVSVLRAVFPRLRVVATTHDPLCLLQTEPGEVVTLHRVGTTGVQAVPRDVPKGLRADQLLTGDWFGLATTTDAETAELVSEHSKLLLQPQTRTRKRRRAALESTLRNRLGHFAETSIERMAHDVAAQVMREESVELGAAGPEERAQLAASVLDAVRRKRGRPR